MYPSGAHKLILCLLQTASNHFCLVTFRGCLDLTSLGSRHPTLSFTPQGQSPYCEKATGPSPSFIVLQLLRILLIVNQRLLVLSLAHCASILQRKELNQELQKTILPQALNNGAQTLLILQARLLAHFPCACYWTRSPQVGRARTHLPFLGFSSATSQPTHRGAPGIRQCAGGKLVWCLLVQVLPELPDRGSLCAYGEAAQRPLALSPPRDALRTHSGWDLKTVKAESTQSSFPTKGAHTPRHHQRWGLQTLRSLLFCRSEKQPPTPRHLLMVVGSQPPNTFFSTVIDLVCTERPCENCAKKRRQIMQK